VLNEQRPNEIFLTIHKQSTEITDAILKKSVSLSGKKYADWQKESPHSVLFYVSRINID
jgi:hypothetical protein